MERDGATVVGRQPEDAHAQRTCCGVGADLYAPPPHAAAHGAALLSLVGLLPLCAGEAVDAVAGIVILISDAGLGVESGATHEQQQEHEGGFEYGCFLCHGVSGLVPSAHKDTSFSANSNGFHIIYIL